MIVDRVTHCRHSAAERRFRNHSAVPDRADQVVLAYDALAVADEIVKEIENLRLGRDNTGPSPQFAAIGVERKILELVNHRA